MPIWISATIQQTMAPILGLILADIQPGCGAFLLVILMNGKKGFILFTDIAEPIKNLSDEDAGKLIKAIFGYQNGGVSAVLPPAASMAFAFIKLQLDRSNEHYDMICERNRINGAKGGRPPKPKEPSGLSGNPVEPKKPKLTPLNPNPNPNPKTKKEAKKEYKPDVYLTETEYFRLTTSYKKEDVDSMIEDLSNALGNRYPVDKFKDHNKTIRNWLKRNGISPIVPPKICTSCNKPYTGTLCTDCGTPEGGR